MLHGSFCDFPRNCTKLLTAWAWTLMRAEIVALQQGSLSGAAVKSKAVKQIHLNELDGDCSTNLHQTVIDAKVFRSCNQNIVAVTVLTMEVEAYRRVLAIITGASEPLAQWESDSNK